MRVLGMISGTSFDAIEVAVADLELDDSTIEAALVGSRSIEYPPPLRAAVAALLPPNPTTIETVCRLDTALGQAFAQAAADVVGQLGPVELVVSHGQTVFHWVDGSRALGTLQLGEPAWIAERIGVPVVSGLRARDIAAGGHGAPLVSLLDVLLLGGQADVGSTDPRGSLNLGGIANLTVVGSPEPIAFDVGPANALLDAAVVALTGGGGEFDQDGRLAARGTVDDALLARLLEEPYYRLPAPKSTGKELFHPGYLAERGVELADYTGPDLLATLVALTAQTVVDACGAYRVTDVVAAGGGTRNPVLMAELRRRGPKIAFRTIDAMGIPPTAKEAYAFALLGFLTVHGLAGIVASCTGAGHPSVLGTITPGRDQLVLPRPGRVAPSRLRIVASDPVLAGPP
ncbi:MAG: anhydro-N-acetylmuramic acid kinase [Sporichthyaceae bacterium]|nr:anhydro-N-acetylmuramic acid kinase [Sporichthyaceae bacterium]